MALTKIICSKCGKEKSEREFLFSSSELYKNNNKIPICKECLNIRFKTIYNAYNGDLKLALQHFCLNFDIYFDEEVFNDMSNIKLHNFVIEYLKKINRNKVNKNRSSLDNLIYIYSTEKCVDERTEFIDNTTLKNTFEITNNMLKRWGKNKFTNEELEILEYKYEELISEYPSEKYQEREIIKDICQIEIQMDRAYKNGDHNAYAKFQNIKSEKMAELNVIPSKQKQYDEDKSMTLGQMIKRFEEEEPIPDITDEFNDVDRIQFNINRYFTKPMRKALGIDKSKYTVEDELDTYENFIEKKKKSKKNK